MSVSQQQFAREELQFLREQTAATYGFALYRHYNEQRTANYIGIDISTLKRWRRKGLLPFPTKFGEDGVRYFGIYIADLIIRGTGPWPDTTNGSSSSGISGSPSEPEAKGGAEPGTTDKQSKLAALRLAHETLKKPSDD